MGIRFYDEALANKIKGWVKDPNIRILKPDETTRLFQVRADIGKDKPITLPLISIARETSVEVQHTGKRPLSFDGKIIGYQGDSGIKLNAIPVGLAYQIDIYTKEYELGDEYVRNFIFNIINYPLLTIEIPYNNINFKRNSYIRLLSDVEDNSAIPEKLFPDQFTRWTLKITVDDAYLFSAPGVQNIKIEDIVLAVASKNKEGELVIEEEQSVIEKGNTN